MTEFAGMGLDIRSYYEARASADQEGSELYQATDVVRALFRKHVGATDKFLDLGCGTGRGTLAVAQHLGAKEIFGVDFTPSYLEAARSRGIQTAQVDLNGAPLPFADGSFDAILCSEVIEHLVDSDNLLREIRRVLTPKAVCVIATPNLASWLDRIALFFSAGSRLVPPRVSISTSDAPGSCLRERPASTFAF